MFVQTGHFVEDRQLAVNEAIKVYGTELKANNARLAKMNLAIHGIEGKIIESNSFYSDPHDLVGKCDFVMANPPFNVNKIDKDRDYVKNDPRLFGDVGIPRADNGNYMWIQYFYHYLNDTGRAGFVMASSATDAGGSEKVIRQKLIETGGVDCIVAVGNNFFYTRSLPCHLWFLDKGKSEANKSKILMIDARNTFRQVNTTLRDFTPDQMEGLSAIVKAYRGEDASASFANNEWLKDTFPNGTYEDVEGLCKIVGVAEVAANDYSLTPGRYVGYTMELDEGFDYQTRLDEIHAELAGLNSNAERLMRQILQGAS